MGNTTTCGGGDDDGDLSPLFFPKDVLIQILVWLPVISLLRFKSVCKSWRALIETPFFTHLHTSTTFNSSSLSSSKFGSFIFYVNCNKMFMLSSISESIFGDCGDTTTTGDEDDDEDIINNDLVDYLGFPPCSEDSLLVSLTAIRMVGSCHGLICIHEPRHNKAVSLWNPVTKQFRYLPKIIMTPEYEEYTYSHLDLVIFGFDVKTKDYKVVYLRCFPKPNGSDEYFSQIQVYSLSTDSWRLLEGIHDLPAKPCNPACLNHGINMNGCHFFVGKDLSQVRLDDNGRKTVVSNNNLIYSFDFTKEILTTIQPPDHDTRHHFMLTLLGEKMALFVVQGNFVLPGSGDDEVHDCSLDYEYYHIWVLNNAQPGSNCTGVVVNKESWTKLYSFRKLNIFKHLSQPRGILNNGKFALISSKASSGGNELQLFNLVTGETIKDFPFGKRILRADTYRPSLVSVIGGNGAAATTTITADRVVGGAM